VDWPPDRESLIVTTPDQAGSGGGNAAGPTNLTLRVASAAVLVPVALVATYAGGWIFLAVCALVAGGILWEWTALTGERADPRLLMPGWAALVGAAAFVGLGPSNGAWVAVALGAVAAGIAAGFVRRDDRGTFPAGWAGGGVLYAGAALLGPALLRADAAFGLTALLFLFATVWITDIFAYFCGRAVGGPLLLPSISPKKTWSGAVGGLVGGVAAGVAVAYAGSISRLGVVGVMAFLLSVAAQGGDLFESAVKRRFGAKDAGQLIPGHGGLMDRLDGFLVAAFVALLAGMIHAGAAAPARGLLVW